MSKEQGGLAEGALDQLITKCRKPTDGEFEKLTKQRGIPREIAEQVNLRRLPLKEEDAKVLADGSVWKPLCSPGWLIPYPKTNFARIRLDSAYSNGTRYLSPPGSKLELYIPNESLCQAEDLTVIAEGEFKALALLTEGYAPIALGGISAFGGRLKEVADKLKWLHTRRVIVGFDRENWMERKPRGRWDPAYWAAVHARYLCNEDIPCKVCLPPEGAKDWDEARSKNLNIKKAIESAVSTRTFISQLPSDGKRRVGLQLERRFFRSRVEAKENGYVRLVKKEDSWVPRPISDFTLTLLRVLKDQEEGEIREYRVNGRETAVGSATSEDLATVAAFTKWVMRLGPYSFWGSPIDLIDIVKRSFLDDHDVIRSPAYTGWIGENKCWLLSGGAVLDGGPEIQEGSDDTVTLPSGTTLRARAAIVGLDEKTITLGLPRFPKRETRYGMAEVAEKIGKTIGDYNFARIGLGWIAASIRSHQVFQLLKSFPLLFISGQAQSGKTTLCRWLAKAGLQEKTGANAHETTQNFLQRELAYYSSMPIWLDDWRNTRKVESKVGMLLGVWNRELAGKGVRGPIGTRIMPVRGTMMISGEHLPSDPAFVSRLVVLRMPLSEKPNEFLQELHQREDDLGGVGIEVMTASQAKVEQWLKDITDFRKRLQAQKIAPRIASNWATVVTAWDTFGVSGQDDLFEWVEEQAKVNVEEREQEKTVNEFLSEIDVLHVAGKINDAHVKVLPDGLIAFALRAAWSLYAEGQARRGLTAIPYGEIMKSFKEEESFVKHEVVRRLRKKNTKCIILRLSSAPDVLKDIVLTSDNMQGPDD